MSKSIFKVSHSRAKQGEFLIVEFEQCPDDGYLLECRFHGKVVKKFDALLESLLHLKPADEDIAHFACRVAVAVDSYGDYGNSKSQPSVNGDRLYEFNYDRSKLC